MPNSQFIAHVRTMDGAEQSLYDHLTGTAEIAKQLAEKIGLPLCGELIGLVHDLGKYSQAFQQYIRNSVASNNYQQLGLDEDEEADKLLEQSNKPLAQKPKRGSVDHSTAGGQWLLTEFQNHNTPIKNTNRHRKNADLLAEILSIAVFSHHSGLINIVDLAGNTAFYNRTQKPDDKTHLEEALRHAHNEKLFSVLTDNWQKQLIQEFNSVFQPILIKYHQQQLSAIEFDFYTGLFTRLIFSCLIDADRSNSIAFEHPNQQAELAFHRPNWQLAIDKVEQKYAEFANHSDQQPISQQAINQQRNHIAQACLDNAQQPQGIFSLTVPTGGGKTLASLRFAVHHAKIHQLERIIFIIPFTSIIEQNADAVREILEDAGVGCKWVLEQHSNLEPNVQTWQSKLIADNWNAPIVFTTMVQFLESCFGGGTKGVRRLHQLTNAVLIFDEIQTLPTHCYHLFINTINFLTQYTQTTAVLCTATQPVLDKLSTQDTIKNRGILHTPTEIIGDDTALSLLFDTLKRVEIHDHTRPSLDEAEITAFIGEKFTEFQSTLVIVNTKAWAMTVYQALQSQVAPDSIYHLSTGQCAKHRKDLIAKIKQRLKDNLPTLVISTQLIEAGVDISFKSVVRFLAGLDSILQASGRCNRHGELTDNAGQMIKGQVFVITPTQENLTLLPSIKRGKDQMATLFYQLSLPEHSNKNLLDPEMVRIYFENLYLNKEMLDEMVYPTKVDGLPTNLLELLADNGSNAYANNDNSQRIVRGEFPKLWQSFMSANKAFKAIDAPTKTVVVPYGDEGKELITDFCGVSYKDEHSYKLVKKAQAYSVNVFPYMFDKLAEAKALTAIGETGIVVLNERFYDEIMGLNPNGDSQMDFLEFSEF